MSSDANNRDTLSDIDWKELLEDLPKTTHSFCGVINENGLRTGHGCQQWHAKNSYQKYSGNFLHNNLHHHGIYFIAKNRTYFDGLFYANKLEGYGQVIYADTTSFEGLFRQHYRFGPGIVTHPDNTQDVGLWDGFSLMRLSTCSMPCFVPTLGRTQQGKTKLLKFRNFAPICPPPANKAEDILQELGANDSVMAQSDQLYNLGVRCPESLFFNRKLYDDAFFTEQDCTIDVVLSKKEFEDELREECSSSFEGWKNFSKSDQESSSGDHCSCIDTKRDKFTQLCVQLHHVEIKLEEIDAEKKKVTKKLKHCKRCCLLRYFEATKVAESEPRHSMVRIEEQVEEKVEDHEPQECKLELEEQSMDEETLEHSENNMDSTTDTTTVDNLELELINYSLQGSSATFLPTFSEPRVNKDHRSSLVVPLKNRSSNKTRSNSLTAEAEGDPTLSAVSFGKELYNDSLRDKIPDSFSQISLDNSEDNIATNGECLCDKVDVNVKTIKTQLIEVETEEQFYKKIRQSLKKKLDTEFVRIHKLSQEIPKYIKKVIVSDLLAWNNEKSSIAMLQHCFRHRKSEENVSFNVTALLAGDRTKFKSPGKYESACMRFLEDCSDGRDRNAFHLLRTWNINPDICDARGNTGIVFAAARDKTNVIGMLVNCGGKLDVMNDEGLTPLLMALLQFLTFKHKVTDWEKAFLLEPKFSEEELVEMKLWRPHESLLNLVDDPNWTSDAKKSLSQGSRPRATSFRFSLNEIFGNVRVSLPQDDRLNEVKEKLATFGGHVYNSKLCVPHLLFNLKTEQKYVLDTEFKRVESPGVKGKKGKKRKEKKKSKRKKKGNSGTASSRVIPKFRRKSSSKFEEEERKEDSVRHKLENVKRTIMMLLSYGSNPNIGEVPRPALILSAFSEDPELVAALLENRANPDVATNEENLTSLHIVASLKPSQNNVDICRTLLKYNANSNIRVNNNHWSEVEKDLVGDGLPKTDIENKGKNVLHLLCLRQDFVEDSSNHLAQMANLLVRSGCNTSDLYLGHTPLSIAVLRQNLELIKELLEPQMVDVYAELGNTMGNVLTLPILKRFSAVMPYEQNQKIIDLLVEYNMNPLHPIGEFESVIEFIDVEKMTVAKEAGKKQKQTKREKKRRNEDNDIEKNLRLTEAYLREVAKKVVRRHIQGRAVGYLYTFITENFYNDPLIETLADMVSFEEALKCLGLIFQYGRMQKNSFSDIVVSDVVRFVLHRQNPHKNWNDQDEDELERRIRETSFLESKPEDGKLLLPPFEIDLDTERYKVCFECLQHKNRQLLKCPKCELVYFCSQNCNISNNKTSSFHKCNLDFYESEKLLVAESGKQMGRLGTLLEITRQLREARIASLELTEVEKKLTHLKFIPKALKEKAKELKIKSESLNASKLESAIFKNLDCAKEEIRKRDHNKEVSNKPLGLPERQQQLRPELRKSPMALDGKRLPKDIVKRSLAISSTIEKSKQSQQTSPQQDSANDSTFVQHEEELRKGFIPRLRRKSQFYRTEGRKSTGTTGLSSNRSSTVSTFVHHKVGKEKTKHSLNKPSKKSVVFIKKKHRQEMLERGVDRNSGGSIVKALKKNMRRTSSSFSLETYKYMVMKSCDSKKETTAEERMGQGDKKLDKGGGKETKIIHNKNYFMKLLTKVFEDFNLPLLLLPYSCYKDGQVYYSMGDQPHFGQMYSKLEIPN